MSKINISNPALWGKLQEVKGFHSTNNAKVYEGNGALYLFSYGTLIARIVGRSIDFTNYHCYSTTTSKHLTKFMERYFHTTLYAPERRKLVKENGYLGVDIPL